MESLVTRVVVVAPSSIVVAVPSPRETVVVVVVVVFFATVVVVGGITLDAGPEPVRQDRSARATWHDRPDVDSYDTETQGAWA